MNIRRLISTFLIIMALGIAATTLFDYAIGHPERTAWTGFVAMSSPEAVALLCVCAAVLISLYDKRGK